MIDILNGKYNPVPELVMKPVFFVEYRHSRFLYQIVPVSFGTKILHQIAAGHRRIAEAELFHRLFAKPPVRQITVSLLPPAGPELVRGAGDGRRQAQIPEFSGNDDF